MLQAAYLLPIKLYASKIIDRYSFFENASENEVIRENPMKRLKRPVVYKNEISEEPLSYNEIQVRKMLRCLETEPLMWKAIVLFVIDSGCRCGEIMGLKWSEIDFGSGKVNICRNIQYTAELGRIVNTSKNGKNRTIYINRPVLNCLDEWKKAQVKENGAIAEKGYCFTKKDGTPLIPVSFNNYLYRFGKKYGFPGIHPHTLRHTMASLSIANGADIVSVSKKLGHAKTSITLDIYSHLNTQAQLRANEILADAIYNEDRLQ